jgi:hypothetical protein
MILHVFVSFALQLRFVSCDFMCVCVSNIVIKLQICSMYFTRFENEVFIHESVGGVGEIISAVNMNLTCKVFMFKMYNVSLAVTFHHKMMLFNL